MVLEHVPHHAGLLVIAGPVLDADGLGGGDLDVVHVLAVPHGLEDRVREAEDEDVLDGLLAEVVVDAEDLVLGEVLVHQPVQLPRRLQVAPERLFDHDAHPRLRVRVANAYDHPLPREVLDHTRVEAGGNREVDEAPLRPGVPFLALLQPLAQRAVGGGIVEVAAQVGQAPSEAGEHRFVHGPRLLRLGQAALDRLPERVLALLLARDADHRESLGHQLVVGQVEEGGHQLAVREVALRAEDDDRAGRSGLRAHVPISQERARPNATSVARNSAMRKAAMPAAASQMPVTLCGGRVASR